MTAEKILLSTKELDKKLADISRPLVFTNGCFDILHRGHVAYLNQSARLGKTLLVAVNSDESVKRLQKDSNRPINHLEDRMSVLAALECVDLVVSFDQDTPFDLIKKTKPDYLVKGGDWPVDQIVGAEFVISNGGDVRSVPFEFDRSTTQLIQRIRSM